MAHVRAKKGGEIGANGEFYEGGKFIATTDRSKGEAKRKVKKTGRREIAPYVWEMQPTPESYPIFSLVGCELKCVKFDYDSKVCVLAINDHFAQHSRIEWLETQLARFNAGERWYTTE